MTRRFLLESLFDIHSVLQSELASNPEQLRFEALHPELSFGHFSGEQIEFEGNVAIYRSYKVWIELAEQLNCRFLTPALVEWPFVEIRYMPLDTGASWHANAKPSGDTEKYGDQSGYFRINKLEEPSFLVEYIEALKQIPFPREPRVLNLGVNRGDEFSLFDRLFGKERCAEFSFVGLDHCASAIAYARERFSKPNYRFIEADLRHFAALDLGQFDLIISIGTLQSPSVRGRELLKYLVKNTLHDDGHMILGFPNCRYIDHEIRYGAKMKNYRRPELSLVVKEVMMHKRYLQQQRFRVILTGKHTLFLTGLRLPR